MRTRNLVIGLLIVAGIIFLLINPTPTVMNQRTNPATNSSTFTSRLQDKTADEVLGDAMLSEIQIVEKEPAYDKSSRAVKMGDRISVHYRGWLAKDGTGFDQSFDRGEPFTFTVGQRIIQGWSDGVIGMQVGEVRRLKIPYSLGYGEEGNGDAIPAKSDLIFDVELVNFD